ncbi:phage tail tip lysozyme [Rhizobium rhizogenes]|uniref:phage tail tip lysozyme n=1 Tax=Rhizobium rhizogenes TaxID=359 RepID=UPI00157306BF|nr:phage tail tip lysozyme [Rhizobium rhizogenes]NTG07262.1 hypothetical protein [Rhizobium rhizogenes]
MATVIDSLIITLGLDPTQFDKGQKQAANAFLKTKQEAEKSGKGIEEASKKAADSISKVTREVLGLYAVFVGARGIKEFVADLIGADAALGRFSRNLNTSPQTLYAWGAAAERVGGSSEQTAATFERIGKALYDLHRNGQALPKEYSQLQALTGLTIDRDHGVDKFLQDTSAAIQRLNQIDPSQVHFIAQGMGIDDGTANVMIKYGAAIGSYIDQIKKLSPSNDAIKAAQDLQDKWNTLQQTAVSLANTILNTLGPEIAKLLTQMTAWVDKNQDWIKSGIVDAIKQFADYLKAVDWNAVGQGLKEFGSEAKHVADAIGGVTTAVEVLFGLWIGAKFLQVLANARLLAATVAGGSAGSSAGGAAAGAGSASLARMLGIAGAAYMLTDTAPAPDMKTIKKSDRSLWDMIFGRKPTDASGHADALQNNPSLGASTLGNGRDGALDAFLNGDTKIDGRPVSKSNPLPVALQQQPSGGGFLESVGNAIGSAARSLFGVGTANASTPQGGRSNALDVDDSGLPNGSASGKVTGSAKRLMDRLVSKHGWSPAAAAIAAGNAHAESGFRSGTMGDPQVPGGSWGLFQWNRSRLARLKQFAKVQGNDWKDFDTQTDYFAKEAEEMIPSWKKQSDLSQADAIGKRFEGYKGPIQRGRSAQAASYLRGYQPATANVPTGSGVSASLSSISNDNRSTSSSSSHNVSIGNMNINAPQAKDAQGIADRATDALYRSTVAATANYGLK